MSYAFDPYAAWLGVAPSGRALNYYELLGLPLFESEPPAIDEAVERQMARVAPHVMGEFAAPAQHLLGELATARVVLLSPAKKREYDASLGAHIGNATPPQPQYGVPPRAMAVATPIPTPVAPPLHYAAAQPQPGAWPTAMAGPPTAVGPALAAPVPPRQLPPGAQFSMPLATTDLARGLAAGGGRKVDSAMIAVLGVTVVSLAGVIAWMLWGGSGQQVASHDSPYTQMGDAESRSPVQAGAKLDRPRSKAKEVVATKAKPAGPRSDKRAGDAPAMPGSTAADEMPADGPSEMPSKPAPDSPPDDSKPATDKPATEKPATNGDKPASGDVPDLKTKAKPKDGDATDPDQPAEAMPEEMPAEKMTEKPPADDGPLPDAEAVFAVKKELGAAREEMGKRNLAAAEGHLDAATLAASAPVLEREVDRTRKLHELLTLFWNAVKQSAGRLQAAEEVEVNGQIVAIVEATEDRLVYKGAGRNHRETLADLNKNLAVVLAEKSLKKDDVNTKLAVAAFLMYDRKGDRGKARKLFDEARRQGADLDALLGDLAGGKSK